jgi:hypothetical protein
MIISPPLPTLPFGKGFSGDIKLNTGLWDGPLSFVKSFSGDLKLSTGLRIGLFL